MFANKPLWYKLEGKVPVPDETCVWAVKEKNATKRIVGETKVRDATVSTVFLGLDHSLGRKTPVLFETLVFGGSMNGECNRYETWDQAEKGHQQMVDRVKCNG